MGDDAHGPSLDGRVRTLEDIIDGLDAEQRDLKQRLADVARLAEIVTQPPQREAPRHAAPKRDRHGLRVIPGGLAAFVPLLLPGHPPAAVLVPAAGRAWLSRRSVRLAAVVLALGLVGATETATADADPPPPHPHAVVRVHHLHRPGW
jgi:hypothetical protein